MDSRTDRCLVLDSSVIIALAEANATDVLAALDAEIIVPRAVYEEVVARGRGRPGSRELEDLAGRGKVRVLEPRDRALVEALHDPLGMG